MNIPPSSSHPGRLFQPELSHKERNLYEHRAIVPAKLAGTHTARGDRTAAQTAQPAAKPFRLPFGLTPGEARTILPDIVIGAVCAGAFAWAWAGRLPAALAAVVASTVTAVVAVIDIRQPWSPGSGGHGRLRATHGRARISTPRTLAAESSTA